MNTRQHTMKKKFDLVMSLTSHESEIQHYDTHHLKRDASP
jgi:hypothetical protein